MVTKERPLYPCLSPGQPPQLRSHENPPPAWCIKCQLGVQRLAPQYPMCCECWWGGYAPPIQIKIFRDDAMTCCHGCGTQPQDENISFGSPLCAACRVRYAWTLTWTVS